MIEENIGRTPRLEVGKTDILSLIFLLQVVQVFSESLRKGKIAR